MTTPEAGLGRNGETNEGSRRPLSEGQRASLKIIQASLPSLTVRNDAPLSNIPFEVLSSMPRFPEIYSALENVALFGKDALDKPDDRTRGIVFHQLAHASLAHASDNAGIVLPEPVAFKVVKALNPDAEEMQHLFSPGIGGSYVPDALEVSVKDGRVAVTGFVEYSTVETADKFVDQIYAAKKLEAQLGSLAAEPEFVIVVPHGSNILVPKVVGGTRVRRVDSEFGYRDVEDAIRVMTQDYRRGGDPDVASISDMARERVKREERIRKLGEPALFSMRQQATMLIEIQRDHPDDLAA